MSSEKPKTVGFLDSLSDLLDSARQIAEAAPGVIGELAPLLPKELQPKKDTGVLPKEISIIFFHSEDSGWVPRQNGQSAIKSDVVGRYKLVKEEPWGEPAPTGEKGENNAQGN